MGLNAEEKKALAALQKKAEEPDTPPPNISFTLDLGNDAAYERGLKLGLFTEPAANGGEGSESEQEADDPPNRKRGYFPNS